MDISSVTPFCRLTLVLTTWSSTLWILVFTFTPSAWTVRRSAATSSRRLRRIAVTGCSEPGVADAEAHRSCWRPFSAASHATNSFSTVPSLACKATSWAWSSLL